MSILTNLGSARQHAPTLSDTELKARLMTAAAEGIALAQARGQMLGRGDANAVTVGADVYQINIQYQCQASQVSGRLEVRGGRNYGALVFAYAMTPDASGHPQDAITWGDTAWAADHYETIISAIYTAIRSL